MGQAFSRGNVGVIVLGKSSLLEAARLSLMAFMSGTLFILCHHLGQNTGLVGQGAHGIGWAPSGWGVGQDPLQ